MYLPGLDLGFRGKTSCSSIMCRSCFMALLQAECEEVSRITCCGFCMKISGFAIMLMDEILHHLRHYNIPRPLGGARFHPSTVAPLLRNRGLNGNALQASCGC